MMQEILQFFGRLHPLVLHLPIGILVLATCMIIWRSIKVTDLSPPLIRTALFWGMMTAGVSAITGYLLSTEGGYEETLVQSHLWAGVATTLLSAFLYFASRKGWDRALTIGAPALLVLLLVTGHLGGSLTHGGDFLMEPFRNTDQAAASMAVSRDEIVVFPYFIEPIFREKCNGCHNESKKKGDLLLATTAGITGGGKSGPLFIPGDTEASLLLKRIHLPLDDKKHMPPKGKAQLTDNEITLLAMWVDQGGTFDTKLAEYKTDEALDQLIGKYLIPEKDVLSLDVPPARMGTIEKLENLGFEILPVARDVPFLSARYKVDEKLDASKIRKLKKIAPQLISLDLSGTNSTDQMLSYLADFPHLQKLDLQGTGITGQGLKSLAGMEYLETLNLVGTKVDVDGLRYLEQMEQLRKLYLWRSDITQPDAEMLASKKPLLDIDTGADKSIFGSASLNAPEITADRDIFTDSLEVAFKINFPGVNLYYTLDGSDPDTLSIKYRAPFFIDKTTEVRVYAQKPGWEASEIASRVFLKSKYNPVSVKLDREPHPNYPANGASSLTDFKKGTTIFRDGDWLGYEQNHFTANFDMGSSVEVSRITVSALESTDQWIFYPAGLEISVSEDGRTFKEVRKANYRVTGKPEPPEMRNFSEVFDPVKARYVQVRVLSHLWNPEWHPAAGQPCWVFVDEVMIE